MPIKVALMPYAHREAWLAAAVESFRHDLAAHGYRLKAQVRVACGWPSSGGLASKARTLGECWSTWASADGANEIFISPVLADLNLEDYCLRPRNADRFYREDDNLFLVLEDGDLLYAVTAKYLLY